MSQPSSLSDRDLKVAIANARWDVDYDAKQIAESQQMERNQGVLGRLLGGPAVDAQTRQDEIAEYEKDARRLQSLVKEAQRRGLDVSGVPARSNQDSYGDL
ncbi:MAG: hypothetical protein K1X65_12550 [Caldilineales bacterium]|nr:hypothetical protein [Caldilineales bacterium]MCW5858570.1 hypothetical protein [Caldilineales bacterium]